jgi:hypothetical protein
MELKPAKQSQVAELDPLVLDVGHAEHALAPAALNVPGKHAVQLLVVEAGVLLAVPATHAVHPAAEVRPVLELHVPSGHARAATALVVPARQYRPAGHALAVPEVDPGGQK